MLSTWLELVYHKIGYTQYCDVQLKQVRTLDLDFEASLAKEVGYLSTVFFQ